MSRLLSKGAIVVAMMGALGLSGCSATQSPSSVSDATTAPVYKAKQMHTDLAAEGVLVIAQGAKRMLVLPTDRLFDVQTTRLNTKYEKTLKLVSVYLHNYIQKYKTQPIIRVSGHTDNVYSQQVRLHLSAQYAEAVASYLWDSGFSHKTLQITGNGALDPIATNKTAVGSAYNRRVVIEVN